MELVGNEMLACLDGRHCAFGSHDGIAVEKANLGFTVAGEAVSFRHLRVWDARRHPTWEATKAKLLQGK